MVRSRWLRRAGPGIVALVALATLASTTVGAPVRPWVPQDCAGDPDMPDIATRVGLQSQVVAPGEAAWFRLDPILDPTGALAGQRLVTGRADGRGERSITLPPESFAAGPFGAIVLAGTDDGTTSRVIALDVLAGCTTALDASGDVIRRATVSPDGGAILEARVDRRSRTDLGIWRRRMDRAGTATRSLPPLEPDGRFGRTWSTDFLWAVGSTDLAIESCGQAACRTRVLDGETGIERVVADPDLGTAVGLANGRLVAYLACRGLPCPIVAIDLATGGRRTLATDAGPAVVTATAVGPRLVHEHANGMGAGLRAVALDGAASAELGALPPNLSLVVDEARSGAAMDVPASWVLLASDGRSVGTAAARAPVLIHVPDGRSAAVDEVTR